MKPTTVLFGSELPERFFHTARADLPSTDLLVVAGTSLVVSPANSVVTRVRHDAVRLIVNNEPVGSDLGVEYGGDAFGRRDDVFGQVRAD